MRIEIDDQLLKSLLVLASVVEARDMYTGGHLWRVAEYSRMLAEKSGLEDAEVFRVTLGGFLHDLGKVGIPDSILLKPGPLTDDEFAVMKTHPRIGEDILSDHPLRDLVIDVVAHHHEWMDGTGYPQQPSDEPVSPYSRIVGLADVFDALTSTRPYRKGMAIKEAMQIIENERASHFDSELVDMLTDLRRQGKLDGYVGCSALGQRLLDCPGCGPTIVQPKEAESGDTVACRGCGGMFHLEVSGGEFSLAPADVTASPEDLRLKPETAPIDEFVAAAPQTVTV